MLRSPASSAQRHLFPSTSSKLDSEALSVKVGSVLRACLSSFSPQWQFFLPSHSPRLFHSKIPIKSLMCVETINSYHNSQSGPFKTSIRSIYFSVALQRLPNSEGRGSPYGALRGSHALPLGSLCSSLPGFLAVVPGKSQGHSHLNTFVLAVPTVWNAFPTNIQMDPPYLPIGPSSPPYI